MIFDEYIEPVKPLSIINADQYFIQQIQSRNDWARGEYLLKC